jgi:DNA-binding beta-propeller fold protein YncE
MSKFTVFQINLSDAQYENNVVREMYLDTIMSPTDKAIAAARDLYEKVAVIDADSFDDVFEIGNIGPEKNIERIAPMHSVSVGDILLAESGEVVYVAQYGFNKINF